MSLTQRSTLRRRLCLVAVFCLGLMPPPLGMTGAYVPIAAVTLFLLWVGLAVGRSARRRSPHPRLGAWGPLLAISGVFTWTLDPHTRALCLGSAARDLLGRRIETLDALLQAVHVEDQPLLRAAAADGWPETDLPLEFRAYLPDGGLRWLSVRYKVAGRGRSAGGRVLMTATDITARMAAQGDLQQARQWTDGVLEGLNDAFIAFDHDRRFCYVNRQAAQILERSQAELLGRPAGSVFGAACREVYAAMQQAAASRRTCQLDFFYAPRVRWFHVRISPHAGGVSVYFSDITRRKLAEALLFKREQEFRALVENAPDIIVRLDAARRYVYVNPAMEATTGYPRETYIGRSAAEISQMHGGVPAWDLAVAEVLATGRERMLEFQRLAGGRPQAFHARIVPEFGPDGQVASVLGILRDISALKQVEAELTESQRFLRELVAYQENIREEEKKRIAREVHDELGQLLMALKMDASWLGIHLAGKAPALEQKIRDMKQLIARSASTVRHIATHLRPAALDWGIQSALEWLAEDFRRHAGIACQLVTDPDGVRLTDAQALTIFRSVQESLTNVARHAEASQVDISLQHKGGHVYVSVTDNGKGMQLSEVSHRAYGLRGMAERAMMLGGTADIISSPQGITSVVVTLPLGDK